MKVFASILSAISLAMASPMAIEIPNLGQTSAVASPTLSFRTPAPPVEPRQQTGQTSNERGVQDADVSFYINDGGLPDNITDITNITDEYLFKLSIDNFEAQRNLRQPLTLDWYSDGCTKAPDRIGRWNFLPACHRHDFGLRNYRKQGRLNEKTKPLIDDQFYKDLRHECATHTVTRLGCEVAAEVYHWAVENLNGPDKDLA